MEVSLHSDEVCAVRGKSGGHLITTKDKTRIPIATTTSATTTTTTASSTISSKVE